MDKRLIAAWIHYKLDSYSYEGQTPDTFVVILEDYVEEAALRILEKECPDLLVWYDCVNQYCPNCGHLLKRHECPNCGYV